MSPWQLLFPAFGSPLEDVRHSGAWPEHLVFVVLFCALVDFVKLIIELVWCSCLEC